MKIKDFGAKVTIYTIGRNKKAIEQYVRHQFDDDIAQDRVSVKEYKDPFSQEPKNKK